MPIKWSAVQVSKVMDEVESQVILADQFITEAKERARKAEKITNLPGYMEGAVSRLIDQLNRMEDVKGYIESVRKIIPAGAIEAEQGRTKHGNTQSLI